MLFPHSNQQDMAMGHLMHHEDKTARVLQLLEFLSDLIQLSCLLKLKEINRMKTIHICINQPRNLKEDLSFDQTKKP
jgi:hypothetical protein